jgi:Tfp pilus assembly protein PilX
MRHRIKPRPRGGTLLIVVVCLAVMVLVFGALVRMGLAEKARSLAEERKLRAAWLAESGLERAWAKLGESGSYAGETWALSAETLRGRDPAVVRIDVEPIEGRAGRLRVTARADYPRDGTSRVRQTRVVEMNRPITVPGESR